MKKLFFCTAVLLLFSLSLGCSQQNKGRTQTPDMTGSVHDYFAVNENTLYVYEGEGSEYASYSVYIDYTSENRVQQRISSADTDIARVIELGDDYAAVIYTREEAYYRENFLKIQTDGTEILLREPIKAGTSWLLGDTRIRTITAVDVSVKTPSGSYKAIEVTTEGAEHKTVDYYAKSTGLVKSVFVSGDTVITSSLAEIEQNVPLVQIVRFYYPDIDEDTIEYADKAVSFYTNDITRKVLEQAYKDLSPAGGHRVFSENTKINSLYLNKDGMAYVDLNSAFVTEMNAGAMYEQMILQSVANTFGNYYNAERVVLTIDNAPYESGHILLKKGESIKVTQ
jgi:hypothetical protein